MCPGQSSTASNGNLAKALRERKGCFPLNLQLVLNGEAAPIYLSLHLPIPFLPHQILPPSEGSRKTVFLKRCQLGEDMQALGLQSYDSSKFLTFHRGDKVDSGNEANVGSISSSVGNRISTHVLPRTPSCWQS